MIDPKHPNTGNVHHLDYMALALGGLVTNVGWLTHDVTHGHMRLALKAHLRALCWALDAEDWAKRLEAAQ